MAVHRTSSADCLRLAGMTINEIALHLGVSRHSVYRWHKSSDPLFSAWVTERDRAARLRQACDDLAAIRMRLEGEA